MSGFNPRAFRVWGEFSVLKRTKLWECDRELVDQILAGSPEHFDLLYEAYFTRVYAFALKRLGDAGEAEDVTQEVFITLLDALESFEGQSTLLVWIFGITRNKVNRRFRRSRPTVDLLEGDTEFHPEALRTEATAGAVAEARQLLASCEAIFQNELSPVQRRIFELKHASQMSIREISRVIGRSEDAVKAQLYRIRKLMTERTPGLEAWLEA